MMINKPNNSMLIILCLIGCVLLTDSYALASQKDETTQTTEDILKKNESEATGETSVKSGPDSPINVIYFHGTKRCKTCLKIESYTESALKAGFSKEVEKGMISWQSIDTDLPENAHYVKDFDLVSSSMIIWNIRDQAEDRWKNLDQIWLKVRDEADFVTYIQDEIKVYLEK